MQTQGKEAAFLGGGVRGDAGLWILEIQTSSKHMQTSNVEGVSFQMGEDEGEMV